MRSRDISLCKSSLGKIVPIGNKVLITEIQIYFQGMFPTRSERDWMRENLPAWLKGSFAFFAVDSTKITGKDSIFQETRQTHYDAHKGFDAKLFVFNDIFGNVIHFEVENHDGHQPCLRREYLENFRLSSFNFELISSTYLRLYHKYIFISPSQSVNRQNISDYKIK